MLCTLLGFLALSAPCSQAAPLAEGDAAPCSGILWSLQQSKEALNCAKVDLPTCKSEAALNRALLAAELARVPPPPGDAPSRKWVWLASGVVGGAVVGIVGGFILRGEL